MTFPSTMLAQSAEPVEIQKADLDLLDKINEIAEQIPTVPPPVDVSTAYSSGDLKFTAANLKASPPAGWLYCNGSAVSRTDYAALFAAIGITHGQGDGSTTFNLPDYRGRFLRGQADGQATDPDRAARTAMAAGGNTGDNIGSVQGHAFQDHTHAATNFLKTGGTTYRSGANLEFATVTVTGTAASGNASTETRPLNAYIQVFIKT